MIKPNHTKHAYISFFNPLKVTGKLEIESLEWVHGGEIGGCELVPGQNRIVLDCSNSASFMMFSTLDYIFRYPVFQLDNPSDAIKQCNEALKLDENDVDALCDRAEAHILNEMYDEGKKMPFFNLYFSCSFYHCFSFISLCCRYFRFWFALRRIDVFLFVGLSSPCPIKNKLLWKEKTSKQQLHMGMALATRVTSTCYTCEWHCYTCGLHVLRVWLARATCVNGTCSCIIFYWL